MGPMPFILYELRPCYTEKFVGGHFRSFKVILRSSGGQMRQKLNADISSLAQCLSLCYKEKSVRGHLISFKVILRSPGGHPVVK